MRLSHYEQFAPRCPACVWRARGADVARASAFDCGVLTPLALERIESREGKGRNGGDVIVHGMLRCADAACRAQFPIIDGAPMILANVRELLLRDGEAVLRRDDVPAGVEQFVGECMESMGAFDRARLYSGAYAWDHYGAGPGTRAEGAGEGGGEGGDAVGVMHRLVEMGGRAFDGGSRVLDVGCATGGVSLELGAMVGESGGAGGLVLGVDTHMAMLRVAQGALRTGVARYPLRREGLVYDRVCAAVDQRRMAHAGRVDFWCCDALVLPLASGSVDACVALHTLDAVASPAGLLAELARVTKNHGRVLLATPFDWTAGVTPMENWLGGRSAHAPHGGDGARVLEWLLNGGAPPKSGIDRLRVLARDDMEWRVRLHARATTHYRTHMLACDVGARA